MRQSLLLLAVLLLNLSCEDNPVKPENQNPIIFSVTVFPEVIGLSDSAIIICNAMDPDGDTLVYDWFSDSKIRIQGTGTNEFFLYNTYENSRILYPKNIRNAPIDTVWISCEVRDRKGGSKTHSPGRLIIKQQ